MSTLNTPEFTADASLYKSIVHYQQKPANTAMTLGVQAALRIPGSPGCGECTPLTWPNGTPTGACARECCDVLGRCTIEGCPCAGSGGVISW
jgi:hypothetical protein